MTVALCPLTARAQEKLSLKLITTIAMPGCTGDFDHFALDQKGNRLFLASEDQKTVEVFDLQTGARMHSIKGFGQPLTMTYLPASNRLIVTDGGDTDAVELVDCKDYEIIGTLKLGQGADQSAYNPVNDYFYVENGGGPAAKTHGLSIIDTKSFKKVGEIAGLPGNSNEGMVIDHEGKKLYVNLTGTDEVGVIDLHARKLIAKWLLPDAHVAHAIALDETNHRLFTATRHACRGTPTARPSGCARNECAGMRGSGAKGGAARSPPAGRHAQRQLLPCSAPRLEELRAGLLRIGEFRPEPAGRPCLHQD